MLISIFSNYKSTARNAGLLLFLVLSTIAGKSQNKQAVSTVINVIFETDMGNDVDDALALDMLYKYMDAGTVNLLAVCSNKNSGYSHSFIQLMNEWYGYPKIPVGKVVNGANSQGDSKNYSQAVCEFKKPDGQFAFVVKDSNSSYFVEAVTLYRKLLAAQPDSSVTIISVGFSTNLARLLESSADEFSRLNGKELVAKKVILLSVMAGRFVAHDWAEYNVKKDIPAAAKLFQNWPGQVVFSPFEVGIEIKYPATSIENNFSWTPYQPVVLAYKSYLPMPYDRPTWDLTSVLYAIEGAGKYFGKSAVGEVSVDSIGITTFNPSVAGKHCYLTVDEEQTVLVKNRLIYLTTLKPKYFAH